MNYYTIGGVTILFLLWIGIAKAFTTYPQLQKYVPHYVNFGTILVTIETEKFNKLLDKLASYNPTVYSIFGWSGFIATVGILLLGFVFFIISAIAFIRTPLREPQTSAQNYLLIPGVNDFLPLSVLGEILIAVVIAMIFHETAHGVYCRLDNMDVESMGLVFLAILPMGAFVRPDEFSVNNASLSGRLKMYSAGITSNLILTVISIIGLLMITTLLISPALGAPVQGTMADSPAELSGVESSLITQVNGMSVESISEARTAIANSSGNTVNITTTNETHTIQKSLLITRVVNHSELSPGMSISEVNGSEISTHQEWITATNTDVISITFEDGTQQEISTGALIELSDGTVTTVTHVNNTQVTSSESFRKVYTGSETLTTLDGTYENPEITQIYSGVNGISTSDTGIIYYDTQNIDTLIYPTSDTSVGTWLFVFFILPFGELLGITSFYGFADEVAEFYTAPMGIFTLANILFWTAWININLAVFNALPMPGLDGGKITYDVLEHWSNKYEILQEQSHYIIRTIQFIPVISLLILIVLPYIL